MLVFVIGPGGPYFLLANLEKCGIPVLHPRANGLVQQQALVPLTIAVSAQTILVKLHNSTGRGSHAYVEIFGIVIFTVKNKFKAL